MISPRLYLESIRGDAHQIRGGQELILGEIIGCLEGCTRIWLPYPHPTLANRLEEMGFEWKQTPPETFQEYDALYFGTPTIVDDHPLFPVQDGINWRKSTERKRVRALCWMARNAGLKKIISGLGSGDISLGERGNDIGKGCGVFPRIVCIKNFEGFTDIVLEADLR